MWESVSTDWQVAGIGDFNGDGRDDILWRHEAGHLTQWLGQANGGFSDNGANAFASVATTWSVTGAGDFNGDGRADVLWRHGAGDLTEWIGQINGGFIDNGANAASTVATTWSVAGIGDFNGDGRDDILWRHDSGLLTEWLGQANGGFVDNGANASNNVATSWSVAGIGDFNGDGRDDILWRHDAGHLTEWLGQANGGFSDNGTNAFANVATTWSVAGVGDFNGDGRDDILWQSEAGPMANWLGTVTGGFAQNDVAIPQPQGDWNVAGVGDFNGDGRDDVLWRNENGVLTNWLATASGGFVVTSQSFLGGGTPPPPPADPANTWELSTGPAWDEVMANLATFFSEMEQNFTEVTQGNDQNSHYRNPYEDAGAPGSRHDAFMALIDSYSVHPYYYEGVDPEFEAAVFSHYYSATQSNGGTVSVTPLAPGGALFTHQNMLMRGTWHPSATSPPPPPPPTGDGADSAIIVYGDRGYWTFESIGYVPSFAPNQPYFGVSLPTINTDNPIIADIMDGNDVDTSALLYLSERDQKTIARLKEIIAIVTSILAQLHPDAKFVITEGGVAREITVRELRDLWSRADFRIDPAHTSDPLVIRSFTGYGNGGVGMAIRNDGDPLFVVDLHYLGDYMHDTADRALHYVLHELIHVTEAGNAVVNAGGTFGTTANPVESWTSRMAEALAAAGGMAYDPFFVPPGYNDRTWGPVGPATYVTPASTGGTGGGGGGSGGGG